MVQSNMSSRGNPRDDAKSPLESLSRTLEALETRLSRLAPASRTAPAASLPSRPVPPAEFTRDPYPDGRGIPARQAPRREALPRDLPEPEARVAAPAARPAPAMPAERRRPSLADAVSEIVMRRQMLDEAPRPAPQVSPLARAVPPARPQPSRPAAEAAAAPAERRPEQRFQSLAGDAEALRAEGGNYTLMADVAAELQRLREELKAETHARPDPRFESMRRSFDDLRHMIENRDSADAIGAGMSDISSSLARLAEEGADRSTLNALRAELEEMRGQFGEMAKEKTVDAVGKRWDAFEKSFSKQAERDSESRTDLKQELERLRDSLRSLASEDHVRAVEKRWDEFETRYLGTPAAPSEDAISRLLRDELEGMREKLEAMSVPSSAKADDERWGALEKRLDSREVEDAIHHLSERMSEIEETLARLPQSLGVAPLEARMHALAAGVEALASRGIDSDLDHFVALEERLDEISRAIVATSLQGPPALDMAPIERIEARIATLTARVDRFSERGEAEMLSLRIAELSDRVEELAAGNAVSETIVARMSGLAERFDAAFAGLDQPRIDTEAIAARMTSLAERFDAAFAELEQPKIDTAAIEERLSMLALRLEEAVQPRVDTEMMRSLEAQIARLSEHLASAGSLAPDDFDQDFDRRLAAVEQRLEENREALISAAREAADETAHRMEIAGDRRQSEHVAQLSENLRSLEQLSRETDDRSNQVFDAVHSTLLKIVDRLEQIETEISRSGVEARRDAGEGLRNDRAAAHMAAAGLASAAASVAQEAPAARGLRDVIARRLPGRAAPEPVAAGMTATEALLDRREPAFDDRPLERVAAPALDASDMIDEREANRPLEPGSGTPDIGALIERVRRNKQAGAAPEPVGEAETRAAARRAAKAAVAEAETLRSPSAGGAEAERRFSLSDLVARRRKTILMGVTAVLVALAALPVGKALLSPDEGVPVDGISLESSATPDEAMQMPAVGAPAGAPAEPAVTKAAAAPSAPRSDTMAPASSGTPLAASAAPSPAMSSATSAAMAPAMAPSSAAIAMTSAPMPADAPQGVVPKSGAAENNGKTDAAVVLASAEAKLPPSAAGEAPAVPAAIGAPALVAAAKASDPKAFFEIGLRLLEGRGGEPKPAEALDWFAQAARRGFAPAQYSLGTLYEKGNGIARDTGAARDWYLLAAKQGNVRAMHNLAVLYATGIEGKSDPETAATWFEEAADNGMRDSQYNLGILYARGSGVDQNLATSYKWFAIVAKAGDKDAAAKRDEVAKSLAPDQLQAVEAEVAGWKEKERNEEANTVEVPKEWADGKSDETASVDMKRAVRNIQAILGKLGYDAGTPDGVPGGKTTTAILAFQKDAGIKQTGKIDETLIRALLERKDG